MKEEKWIKIGFIGNLKYESFPEEVRIPEALSLSPSEAFSHGSLQKVKVIWLVILAPNLFRVDRIAPFGDNVYILYVAKIAQNLMLLKFRFFQVL